MIKFLLPIEIYRHEIYFAIGDINECKKIICKDLLVDEASFTDFIDEKNGGATVCFNEGVIVLWVKKPNKQFKYDLNHEINHACNFILRNVGIEHNIDTEEAYAYLKTFVQEKVDEILKNHRKEKSAKRKTVKKKVATKKKTRRKR